MRRPALLACLLAASPLSWARATGEPEGAYLQGLIHERFGRPADALAFYRRAAALDPSSRFLQEALTGVCLRLNLLDEALAAAERAAALSPDAAGHVLKGRVHLARNDRSAAARSFDDALALNPAHDEALLYAAYLRASDDPAGALPFLERYLKENPGSAEALFRMAQLHEALRDFKAAEAAWRRALERDPSSPAIHAALGRMAEARGDRAAAAESYAAARFLDPDAVDILIPLGENLYRLGRAGEAREALERAASLDPSHAAAHFGLALIAEDERDWPRAARHLASAAQGSHLPGVRLQLAYAQSMAGQAKDALKTLRSLHRDDPKNVDALVYLGLAYEDVGRHRRALDAFQKALALDPSRADAQFHAGTNWDALKRFGRAEPHLLKAVELDPRHAAALNYLGYSWADRGVRLEEALALIRRALKEEPENPAFLDSLGWCLFKLGRPSEAEGVLSRAAHADEDPLVWEHYGDALSALGRPEEAARAWEEGLLWDPRSRSLRRRLGPRAAKRARLLPSTAARSTLKRVEANFISLRGAAGAVTVSVRKGIGVADVNGVFYYRKPGAFRLEILDALWVPQAVVVRNAAGLHIRAEEAGAVVPPQAQSWLDLLGEVLSGEMTKRFDDPSVTVEREDALLTYRGGEGELVLDGREKTLVRFSGRGIVLRFDDYRDVEGVRWPGLIRLESPRERMAVSFSFRSPRMNPGLDAALFDAPGEAP